MVTNSNPIKKDSEYQKIDNMPDIKIEGLDEKSFADTQRLIREFITSYKAKDSDMSDEVWLQIKLAQELPQETQKNIASMSREILQSVAKSNECLRDAKEARAMGQQPHEWFADRIEDIAIGMDVNQFGNTLEALDNTIRQNNQAMTDAVLKRDGTINMNPHLDGFIAEQELVNSFNANAQINNSNYEARVLKPEAGSSYNKNSVDIGVYEKNSGKLVRRYQSKFYNSVDDAVKVLKDSYRGQRVVVPEGQAELTKEKLGGKRSVTDFIEAPDGTRSKSISKIDVKEKQKYVQENGVVPKSDWKAYSTRELAVRLGKDVAYAGVVGVAIGTGVHLAKKNFSNEEIHADETIAAALKSGADAGIKAATAAAVTVAADKGLLPILANVSPSIITNIVHQGIEIMKVLDGVLSGDIDPGEAMAQLLWIGVSEHVAGAILSGVGTIGTAISILATPVGAAIGLATAAVVGVMAFGSEICDAISSVAEGIGSAVSDVWEGMTTVVSDIGTAVGEFFESLFE